MASPVDREPRCGGFLRLDGGFAVALGADMG